jgi:hypothetical protein
MTKADLVQEIAHRIGVEVPPMSTGSTEPRQIFDLVVVELGLPIESEQLTKPDLAHEICRIAEVEWDEALCESAGGTVTKVGLQRVLTSVELLLGTG